MADREESPGERVVIEHDQPVSAKLTSLSKEERAFRHWMDQRALEDEPEAGSLDDDER